MGQTWVGWTILAPNRDVDDEMKKKIAACLTNAHAVLKRCYEQEQTGDPDNSADFLAGWTKRRKMALVNSFEHWIGLGLDDAVARTSENPERFAEEIADFVNGHNCQCGYRKVGRQRVLVYGEHTWDGSPEEPIFGYIELAHAISVDKLLKWR